MSTTQEWLSKLFTTVRKSVGDRSRRTARCAILIDGDNIPPRAGDAIFQYANTLGRITSARLFANFAGGGTSGWATQIRKHGISAAQHFNTGTGKNGADIALAIAALDLAHDKKTDTYIIGTSDADLAPVAHRLRQSGATVHGIGSPHAAPAFKQGCDVFLGLDRLAEQVLAKTGETPPLVKLWSRPPVEAEDILLHAMLRLGGARQWVDVPKLGLDLSIEHPSFDPRSYRSRNLTDLLDALTSVELDRATQPPRARIALATNNEPSREPVSDL